MRTALRLCMAVALGALIGLGFLVRHLLDLGDQYHAGSYVLDLLRPSTSCDPEFEQPSPVGLGDKVIVMGRLEEEDVAWVEEELPDWQRALYVVNPSRASLDDPHTLTTPMNKGHEAMAYLTYIIDHYAALPATLAFLHSHRSGFLRAWHVDAPLHDNAAGMRALQLDFVQRNGYVNLRCNPNPGCLRPVSGGITFITEEVWREIFTGTSTDTTNTIMDADGNSTAPPVTLRGAANQQPLLPQRIGAACCAQFAVSRDQVLKRPLEDYIQFRDWVMRTDSNDRISGRVMEYLWHIIFSMDAVYCPDEDVCNCQVYGRC